MGHGSAGIYLSSFPERLVSREEIDKKLDKQIKAEERKQCIDNAIHKIMNLFNFKKTKSQ